MRNYAACNSRLINQSVTRTRGERWRAEEGDRVVRRPRAKTDLDFGSA